MAVIHLSFRNVTYELGNMFYLDIYLNQTWNSAIACSSIPVTVSTKSAEIDAGQAACPGDFEEYGKVLAQKFAGLLLAHGK